jgi:hypothetical protein
MSENSLEIRNKFINKINNKIKDLNENITLLAKVDNKIFKNSQYGGNINRQTGGDGDPGIQANKTILKLMKKVKVQPDLKEISNYIDNIKEKLAGLYKTIDTLEKAFGSDKDKEYLESIMEDIREAKEPGDEDNKAGVLGEIDFKIINFIEEEYKKDVGKFNSKYTGDYKQIISLIIEDAVTAGYITERPADNLHLRYTQATYTEQLQEMDEEIKRITDRAAAKAAKAAKAITPLLPQPPPTTTPPQSQTTQQNTQQPIQSSTKYLRGFF